MSEYVDWPNGHDEPVGLTVLLPGRNYPATMPLLTFAGRAAVQHGWHVRAVSWDAPDLDTEATVDWVGTQLAEAVGDFEGRVLVVGKSLGTCGAAYAAARDYEAIWLTPLLHLPQVVQAMSDNTNRQMLIGGTDDPAWNPDAARSTGGTITQIDDADHGMFTDDAVRSAEIHVEVTREISRWLGNT
ncbi:alpha/beta hydrolase [Brevibacterium linens]|uniref:Alpha/beta hydrolase n=1 Tax=Brevibacterium linens TaxID=1703 RepID=A0A0B9A0H6_BRELN|nr:alpha/beta hydrolase [Brevibacterium linens]KHS52099.1 hypothetical protein AE0388_2649 [Brevibacterium linens]